MKEKGGKRRDEGAAAHGGKEHFRRCSRHFNPHWVDFLPLAREKCYEFAFCRLDCENSWRMPDDFPFFSPHFLLLLLLYIPAIHDHFLPTLFEHICCIFSFFDSVPGFLGWPHGSWAYFVFFGYVFYICDIRRTVQVWCNLRKNNFVFNQNAK